MPKRPKSFYLTPEWPVGLPDHCESCGNKYDILFALEYGPGRLGRFLRRIAPWMSIVMFLLMFVTKFSFFELSGNGAMMAFAVALVLPSVVLWIIGGLLPFKVRLYCFKCERKDYFHPPDFLDNRISRVSE